VKIPVTKIVVRQRFAMSTLVEESDIVGEDGGARDRMSVRGLSMFSFITACTIETIKGRNYQLPDRSNNFSS